MEVILLISTGTPAFVTTLKVTLGALPGVAPSTWITLVTRCGSIHLDYLGDQAGERRGVGRDEVRAGDGGIEIRDVVGRMAVLALVVVGLRQVEMVGAGGE